MKNKKLIKYECEICGWKDEPSLLHKHHCVERTEINTSNHASNLCIICSICHGKLHAGLLKIIGIYPSTRPPNGRTVIFKDELNGKQNVEGIDKPYYTHKPKQMKVPFVTEEKSNE